MPVDRITPLAWLSTITLVLASLTTTPLLAANNPGQAARQPVAMALTQDEGTLVIGNQRSGTLTLLNLATPEAIAEYDLGVRISHLIRTPDGAFLATDESKHELIRFGVEDAKVLVEQRIPVASYPVNVVVNESGTEAIVSSLWSRRLSFVELNTETPEVHLLDLPFAPRCQLLVKNGNFLIVADSFGGKLGIVDVAARKLLHTRNLPAHNIRGLGLSDDGKMLLIAHQMLNELAHTVRNDVHWGLLMSNDLRWLRLDAVLSESDDIYAGAHMHPLGHASSATGDPSGLVVNSRGIVAVSLGGVGEVAIGKQNDFSLHRLSVGDRPTNLVSNAAGDKLFVLNTFSESVSIVDLEKSEREETIPLAEKLDLSLEERGERLFYDASLSHDSWMSCHSCHTDGHTNGLLNDNFSDASFGAPKRVLSLLGKRETAPFAWNASAESLEMQIRKSIEETMQSDQAPRDEHVVELQAYLDSLTPPPSIDAARGTTDVAAIARGREVFAARECGTCHTAPTYTSPGTYQVGLKDQQGNDRFNPPSLLGVGQRGPYFHDNRAKSLRDVFREFGHQQKDAPLSDEELNDLLAFLRSL